MLQDATNEVIDLSFDAVPGDGGLGLCSSLLAFASGFLTADKLELKARSARGKEESSGLSLSTLE